ncbi:MAG: phosphoglucomutase/phosphomannomutase family protein [Candidatus Omnitrophica bacterium]|nr:phosphoglucomutase/phosphomannomutase family protein [Candidatus Omnitrophota bacterium]
MTSSIQFGTDGWRSLVAEDFTLPNVRAVTQGVAEYLQAHPASGRRRAVLVGYDTRPLGDRFAEAVAEVFAGNGFGVFLTQGPMPTPAISFAIRELKLSGGIAVTASHNPFTYNGLKFKPFYAGPAEPEMTRWIERRLFKRAPRLLPLPEGLAKRKIQRIDLRSRYLAFLKGYVDWRVLKNFSFRIGYDSMHGAGQDLLQELARGSRLKIFSLRGGGAPVSSSHRPEPVGEHLGELASFVRRMRCDAGLATDGDADRAGVVGPDGRFVSSQETMSLLLWHLLEDRGLRGKVVTTVAGTNLMDAITAHYGVDLVKTPVGFKHIARLMREEKVLFGGEESGGFGFRGCVPERDGLLAGLLILEMMSMRRKGLTEILRQMRSRFGRWLYSRVDLALTRPMDPKELERWAKRVRKAELGHKLHAAVKEIQTMDGVKVIFSDGSWLLLRPSGTEPLLRVYAEAKSPGDLQGLLGTGRAIGREILPS